ncbi:MAG: ferrous iron transport protein B [Bacteroidales bacterium]|nr:ferrous iron transport protein B [Bacteroidales bacterium]
MTKIERRTIGVLDRLTTNPWTAFPIFILVVYFLFWCTFSLGTYPMGWIQAGVDVLSAWLNSLIDTEWLRDLVVGGVLAGVGGVLVFLPNIIILYLLISVMESSGYMGRVAFIMDKLMHHMGLHGKSFIPMIMGFGCNVPAILACKDIKPYKSRLITVMVIPFLSCSGRLPVYLLMVAAFFPKYGPLLLLGIYALGLVLAVFAAKILSVVVPGVSEHDHVEIKPYMMPHWSYVLGNTWEQVKEYLKKLAGPILIFSVALWTLGYFPRGGEGLTHSQQKEQSCIGMIGHAMAPVLEPVGMNWKDGIAIVAGVGAKELIVSTLGVMYSDGGGDLQDNLRDTHTKAGALAFMIFVLLYFPCIGTFVALRHVTGNWGWTVLSAVNSILVAWVMSFAAFHIFSLIL